MSDIKKALQELAKLIEETDNIESVRVSFTIKKDKPDKAKPKDDK